MSSEIKPVDVFDRVNELYAIVVWLARLVIALAVLVVLQIGAKFVIFGRVNRLLTRVESLLELAEKHGTLNDTAATEIKEQTILAAKAVAATVRNESAKVRAEVPLKVASLAADVRAADSSTNLGASPAPAPPVQPMPHAGYDGNDPRN